MAKSKKLLCTIFILCLAFAGLWGYWEQELMLEDRLPEEAWTEVSLYGFLFDEHVAYLVDESAAAQLLAALEGVPVNRGAEFETLGIGAYQLWLKPEEGYPTVLTVREDGRICVMPQLDDRRNHYYEDGKELYQALSVLSANCTVKE